MGGNIVTNNPTFDSRNYGHAKLGALMKSLTFVETKQIKAGNGGAHLAVRLRTAKPSASKQPATKKSAAAPRP